DLRDDLHPLGRGQRREGVQGGRAREGSLLDLCERAGLLPTLRVFDCAGREVGEHHQCAFGVYLGPLTPYPSFARIGPSAAPITTTPTAIQTNIGASRQNATVPA